MLERQKEKQTQIFNFFKFQKKEEHTVTKAGRYTFIAARGVFKFISYSFGTLFLVGVGMTIINAKSKEERLKFRQDMELKAVKLETIYSQKVSQSSYEIIDLVKKSKTSEETIKDLTQKYKQNINYSYADKNMISFNHRIDYRPINYIIKFDNKNTNIKLLNSSPQIYQEFDKLVKERKDITWSKKSDNQFDKVLNSDYLSIDIKE